MTLDAVELPIDELDPIDRTEARAPALKIERTLGGGGGNPF